MAEQGSESRHYLFCLRHFNDIDNITPAIHFLLERRPVRVTVLIYSLDYDFRADPSLRFLQRTWGERLRVVWIGELAGYSEALIDRPRARLWHYRLRRVLRRPVLEWGIARTEHAGRMREWLEPLFAEWGRPASVIFDQNRSSVIAGLLAALRASGVERIVTLPVSPWINFNVLRQVDFIRVDAGVFWKKHDYSGFDAMGQVDSYYRDSLEAFFKLLDHPSPFQGRERILGAIRFSDEWLAVRQTYAVDAAGEGRLPPAATGQRRLLVLPSHRKNNSFWEEYLRTLHFLAQFEDYDIVVKPHTRYGDSYDDLPENIRLAPDLDTSALIDWSEIILFWGSSVVLEGFQKGRTMINLDYLNGNRSVFTLLGAGYLCRCRDDLLAVLCGDEAMERAVVASVEGRELVRRDVIEGGQSDGVVERYLDFCEGVDG
ncbi:hypothetical protein D893_02562 [Thioalkalivibrio sp. ALE21]|uniref:hypothetical protein n=1 Tax=Thioalkalivibrio sp. ALE21 TaxID=1158175 RepID=UPI000D87910D|nr:hypothetical protein [Thioalkalivibrio sp. ALE21]PYF99749.1 hypothetical protein D893_02562 [Thioalkalivibrio sp. ALE21]